MAIGETARLIASLELDPKKFNAGVTSALGKMGKLEGGVARMGKGAGQLGAGLARSGAIIGTAVVGGLVAAAKVGADFEAQLNTINTIARATPEGLAKIGDSIRAIARDTGKPLEELTKGYYDLLSAGIDAADAQNVLTQANTLAIGGLASTAETVDLLTTAINVYGGDASKAAEFTDDFATAVERGKVTAAELAASYAQVAPLARSLGIENAELAAGYATLTASGTPAAEAATQMASALTALLKKTPGLEKLEKATGRNYAAIAGKKGLNVALEQMRVDADKAGIELVDLVGRKEALLYILQTTGPNLAAYNADLAAMATNAGTAAEQMSERQKGLAFEVGRLKANLKDAGIELAAGFLPALSRSADKLTTFLNTDANRTQLRAIGEDIGKAIDSIDWGKVLDGAKAFWEVLKNTATIAKTLFDIVNTLPTEIKAAGLGLLAVNKLSGGLVASGLGNIFGGLAESLAKNLGSMLPGGAGKAFVQKVWVTNPGFGTGGGPSVVPGGRTGLSALSKVFLVGEAIGLVLAVKEIGEGIGAERTKQAEDIRAVLQESLAGPQTMEQLQTKLAAIDTGIAQLPTDPLGGLVTSGAIAELKAMRADVLAVMASLSTPERDNQHADAQKATQAKLAAIEDGAENNRIATITKIEALRTTATRLSAAEKTALDRVRERAEANRIATQAGTVQTRTSGSGIEAAIRALALTSNITINVPGMPSRTYQTGTTLYRSPTGTGRTGADRAI